MSKIAEKKAWEAYPMNEYEFDKAKKSDIERKRFAYIKGYDQAMQDFLEKAVEWLEEHTTEYASFDDDRKADWENKMNFIEDFKNYMQDEIS